MALYDDVVIAGVAGRFPESANVEEFWHNLLEAKDMVTEDDRRWPKGFAGIPLRKGSLLHNLEEFDAEFFGVSPKQVDRLDPQIRQLLEVTWEAIFDVGINPSQLRGKNIGVYIGADSTETFQACRSSAYSVSSYDVTCSAGCMFANRISYAFDLQGPSLTIDTYCSSSLMAFHIAVSALRANEIEGAIVGGINLQLDPLLTLQIKELGALSKDGKCKCFDASGDGYVRADAVVAVYITKRSQLSRLPYATVVHTKANADGYKTQGISHPSCLAQETLMQGSYKEACINPLDVVYVEAHGTGTSVGDYQELKAISSVFCSQSRLNPLLIGSTKSNIGHAEAASGLCSVIKIALTLQKGIIPPNLHFSTPNPNIPELLDGRIQVVTGKTEFKGRIAAINGFGIGGSNIHVILQSEDDAGILKGNESILPELVPFSGRTVDGLQKSMQHWGKFKDIESALLLRQIHEHRIVGHGYRGYLLFGEHGEVEFHIPDEPWQTASIPPLWFVFPGMGTQWSGMAKEILKIPAIRKSLEESSEIVKVLNVDLMEIVAEASEDLLKQHLGLAFITVGMALVDLLKTLDLKPNGFIGHSAGEYLCAYLDDCMSKEEAIFIVHKKDVLTNEYANNGAMASVGLSWEEALTICPLSIYAACHNSVNNVTLSGPSEEIKSFVQSLRAQGIFAREVETGGVAYHSPYLNEIKNKFQQIVEHTLVTSKKRSAGWISTSVPEELEHELSGTWSPDYVVNNFISPVRFHTAVQKIPEGSILLQVGSHSLFHNLLKKSLPSCKVVSMMKRGSANVEFILNAIGTLYNYGLQPKFSSLELSHVRLPAPAHTLSSLVQWDYAQKFPLLNYVTKAASGGEIFQISLTDEKWSFLRGHCIDGRLLFPATGYLVLAWNAFAASMGKRLDELSVQFKDVKFERATILSAEYSVDLQVSLLSNGTFLIKEKDDVLVTGQLIIAGVKELRLPSIQVSEEVDFRLKSNDVYKDFRLRGYNYSGYFQSIIGASLQGDRAIIKWNKEWIPFLDSIIQVSLIGSASSTGLYIPSRIRKITIDPLLVESSLDLHSQFKLWNFQSRKVIQGQGICIQGCTLSWTPRRTLKSVEPSVQSWDFVEYADNGKQFGFPDAVKFLVDIVVENVPSSQPIRISENSHACHFHGENSLLTMVGKFVTLTPSKKWIQVEVNPDLTLIFDAQDMKNESNTLPGAFVILSNKCDDATFELGPAWRLIAQRQYDVGMSLTLYRKKIEPPKNISVIEIKADNLNWLGSLQTAMAEVKMYHRIWLVSYDFISNGLIGMVNCLRREFGGDRIRCYMSTRVDSSFNLTSDLIEKDLTMNIVRDETIGSYRSFPKAVQNLDTLTNSAFLNLTAKGDLSTFCWIEQHARTPQSCEVYYAPLNFRDMMLAVAKLSPDSLPRDFGRRDCILGLEFAGIESKSGRRVMGILPSMGLATHVIPDPLFTWQIPCAWSLAEAATIPVAYTTAFYALVMRGEIKTGSSIFITSGTGSVGQAAITIALSYNCEIFTTVGSDAKKSWLLERFPKLLDSHILSSNSSDFELQVLKLTSDRGVDLVLNSLAGDKLQAAIRLVALNGKFLEIGKFDLSNNSALGMEVFLRNISFHGILLDSFFEAEGEKALKEKSDLANLVVRGIESKVVQPLCYRVFQHTEAESAFRFFGSGKHIGKVILCIRNEDELEAPIINCVAMTYFDSTKVHVIIGGLGGFGLELVSWMSQRGAKIFALLNQTGQLSQGYQELKLERWEAAGVKVLVDSTTGLNCLSDVNLLLQTYSLIGDIGSIFNLGMVLRDGVFSAQTVATFEAALRSKLKLTQLFDRASRVHCPKLDHFVTFSSVVSVYGNAGQTNYGFANSAMERICEDRRLNGFPGLAIAWGAIGDVGVVHDKIGSDAVVAGTISQSLNSCLSILNQLLHPDFKIINSTGIVSSMALPDDKVDSVDRNVGATASLTDTVAKILGYKSSTLMQPHKMCMTLADLGLDSLMVVEVKQSLDQRFNIRLTNPEILKLTWEKLTEFEKN